MALLLPVMCAALMALACLLALPEADAGGALRVRRPADATGDLVRLLERMGASELVQTLLALGRVELVAREVKGRLERRWGLVLTVPGALSAACVEWGLAALFAAWWSASVAGALVALVACAGWVLVRSSALLKREAAALAAELPALFRAVAGSLSAGQSLPQAIEYAATHGTGAAAGAFLRVSMRLRCGDSLDGALARLGEELDAPGVGLLVSALRISRRTGSPLGNLLEEAAELVERQQEFEQLLAVKTAQARLSARIVCSMPVVMVGLLLLISPDFQRGTATPVGMVAILGAALLDALALLAIRRVMRSVM